MSCLQRWSDVLVQFFLLLFFLYRCCSPTSTLSLRCRYMSNSPWHLIFPPGTLMTLSIGGLGDMLSSEGKREREREMTNHSSCRASKHLPSRTPWVKRREVNTGSRCPHISAVGGGRKQSPPASEPNTPVRPLQGFQFNGFSGTVTVHRHIAE